MKLYNENSRKNLLKEYHARPSESTAGFPESHWAGPGPPLAGRFHTVKKEPALKRILLSLSLAVFGGIAGLGIALIPVELYLKGHWQEPGDLSDNDRYMQADIYKDFFIPGFKGGKLVYRTRRER